LESELATRSASCLNSQPIRQLQPLRIEDNPRSRQIRTVSNRSVFLAMMRGGRPVKLRQKPNKQADLIALDDLTSKT